MINLYIKCLKRNSQLVYSKNIFLIHIDKFIDIVYTHVIAYK